MAKKLKIVIPGFLALAIIIPVIVAMQTSVDTTPSTSGIVGVNDPVIWYDSQGYAALDAIESNGFNTVRIVWKADGVGSRLKEVIDRCKELGLKPIPEFHDVTGGTNGNDISGMCHSWIKIRSNLDSDVWINIANEWGPKNSPVWRDAYISGIKKLREAGMTNTIVVDSGGFGQDDMDILNYGPAILEQDTNVVFSIHMYGSWNENKKINTFLTSCQRKGLPILVGEFGYNYNDGDNNLGCKVDAPYLVSLCKSKGIGYLGWSWCGNDDKNAWLDMTDDWETLNTWGEIVKGEDLSPENDTRQKWGFLAVDARGGENPFFSWRLPSPRCPL